MKPNFKSGMLALLSPLTSAIAEVAKDSVKPEAAAVVAVTGAAALVGVPVPAALLLAAPVALAFVGRAAEKLCDRVANKFDASSLNKLCFASLASLFQDLITEASARLDEDRETLEMWHEVTSHAVQDKTWAALLAATELPHALVASWVIDRKDPQTLWPGIRSVLEIWLAAARWRRMNPSSIPPIVPFPPQPNSVSAEFNIYLSVEIPSRWLAALRRDVTSSGQEGAFRQLQLEIDGLIDTKLDRLMQHACGLPKLTTVAQLEGRSSNRLIDLLRPQHPSALALVGREVDLTSLKDWLFSSPSISIRCVVGRGGAGKTRLAIELLRSLPDSWVGGFVSSESFESFLKLRGFGEWEWTRSTLLILDYAASQVERLEVIVKDLRDRDAWDMPPLRILLLERQADPKEGWYGRLSDSHIEGAAKLFDTVEPVQLSSLALTDRHSLFAQAMKCCAAFEAKVLPAIPQTIDGLEKQQFEDPLVVAMAGFTAVEKGIASALILSRADLATDLANHERRRIAVFSSIQAPEALLLHMAAYATLVRGIDQDLYEVISEEATALGHPGLQPAAFAARARPIPLDAPIEPDIIGEAFVLAIFAEKNQNAVATVKRAVSRHPIATTASLIRLAQDFWQRPEPLQWLKAIVEAGEAGDSALLYQIEAAIPQHCPIGILEWALELTLALERKISVPTSPEDPSAPEYARLLNNLSVRQSAVGRREEALGTAQEAVTIRRELARRNPEAFLPHLAGSLNNLANMQSAVGRREEALGTAQEALTIRRELARRNPEAFLPDLAISLGALSQIHAKALDWPGAHRSLAEAIHHYRELARRNPEAFLPDVAMSLNNLATMQSAVGRREEALGIAQEAVSQYRELARRNPEAFLPNLAESLGALSQIYGKASDWPSAHRSLAEAIPEMLPLFEALPAAHASLVVHLAQNYLKACAALNLPPNQDWLARIRAKLPPDTL